MAYGASVVALLVLSVLLIVGKLSEELFSKFRLIPFVGAIVAGIVLGPGLTGILSASPYVEEFINLGIIFILFMAGVEEELAGILSEKRAMLTGSMIFGLSFAGLMLILDLLLHLPLLESAVLAVVLGMVSAGPFARTLQETGGIRDQKTLRAFAEVMSLEITAILVFAFLTTPGSTSNWSLFFATALKVAVVVGLILAFGRFAAERLIGLLESYLRSREASFSMVMGIVLGFGFLAQYVGFNSAIAAFLLGAFMSRRLKENAYMLEKLRAVTYGFFEPMFFAGLGLYFVRLTPYLLGLGLALLALALAVKYLFGALGAKLLVLERSKNFFAISHEGGVDGAVLLAALGMGMVDPRTYSFTIIAVTGMALLAPLGYQGGIPLRSPEPSPSIQFVRHELKGVTAEQLSNTLSTVSISSSASLQEAAYALENLRTRVLIVVDGDTPVGYVTDDQLLKALQAGGIEAVSQLQLRTVPTVRREDPADKVLSAFESGISPVVAVVDDKGKLIGSVLEREVLRFLMARGEGSQ